MDAGADYYMTVSYTHLDVYKRQLPVLWDVTDVFYDRTTCTFKDKDLLDGLMAAKETERNV